MVFDIIVKKIIIIFDAKVNAKVINFNLAI